MARRRTVGLSSSAPSTAGRPAGSPMAPERGDGGLAAAGVVVRRRPLRPGPPRPGGSGARRGTRPRPPRPAGRRPRGRRRGRWAAPSANPLPATAVAASTARAGAPPGRPRPGRARRRPPRGGPGAAGRPARPPARRDRASSSPRRAGRLVATVAGRGDAAPPQPGALVRPDPWQDRCSPTSSMSDPTRAPTRRRRPPPSTDTDPSGAGSWPPPAAPPRGAAARRGRGLVLGSWSSSVGPASWPTAGRSTTTSSRRGRPRRVPNTFRCRPSTGTRSPEDPADRRLRLPAERVQLPRSTASSTPTARSIRAASCSRARRPGPVPQPGLSRRWPRPRTSPRRRR